MQQASPKSHWVLPIRRHTADRAKLATEEHSEELVETNAGLKGQRAQELNSAGVQKQDSKMNIYVAPVAGCVSCLLISFPVSMLYLQPVSTITKSPTKNNNNKNPPAYGYGKIMFRIWRRTSNVKTVMHIYFQDLVFFYLQDHVWIESHVPYRIIFTLP